MNQQTIIMTGIQGSGKGTQVKLLEAYLEKMDERSVFRFETGSAFRALSSQEGYTSNLVRESMREGKQQPLFLTVSLWANGFIQEYAGDQHVLIDGFPRSLEEARVLHTALEYYDLLPATVVSLNVSDTSAAERMKARGRDDDTDEGIAERIDWYKKSVEPVIAWYRAQTEYHVIDIDGEDAVDPIHESIVSSITT